MGHKGMDTHPVVTDRPDAVTVVGLLVQAQDIDSNRYFLVRDTVTHRSE